MRSRNILRLAVITACLLLIPALGNRFIDGWNWDFTDFIFAGALLFGTGLAYELLASKGGTIAYRAAIGLALGTAFLLVWINAAVGIIGDGDLDSPNGMYFGVLAIGIIGALIARCTPRGMARTLFAMALAQMAAWVIALLLWPDKFAPGVVPVFGLNTVFAMLFAGSGLLFLKAARGCPSRANGKYVEC